MKYCILGLFSLSLLGFSPAQIYNNYSAGMADNNPSFPTSPSSNLTTEVSDQPSVTTPHYNPTDGDNTPANTTSPSNYYTTTTPTDGSSTEIRPSGSSSSLMTTTLGATTTTKTPSAETTTGAPENGQSRTLTSIGLLLGSLALLGIWQ